MNKSPEQIRETNLQNLTSSGFMPAQSLPMMPSPGEAGTDGDVGGVLRPTREMVRRYLALLAVFAWASAPAEMEPAIFRFIDSNKLADAMTEEEKAIIQLDQAEAVRQHQDTIGWRLENMWSLAWILGLAPVPSATSGQLSSDIIDTMLEDFVPEFDITVEDLLAKSVLQEIEQVVVQNDLFYCAHNAVRSAQLGSPTVPDDFDPVASGGAIHERRHSLMWALSPGTEWDNIELHT